MGAQLVDRGKAHHALRHLRLDRAVGIKRIGHAVDDAGFEHRHRRLFGRRRLGCRRRCGRLRSSRLEGRRRPRRRRATRRGRLRRPHTVGLRPGVVEARGRSFRCGQAPRARRVAAAAGRRWPWPRRARAPCASSRRTSGCAGAVLPEPRAGAEAALPARPAPRPAGARAPALRPARAAQRAMAAARSHRRSQFRRRRAWCIWRSEARRQHRPDANLRRRGGSGQTAGDALQLERPRRRGRPVTFRSRRQSFRSYERAAEAEIPDRIAKSDRKEARHHGENPCNQQCQAHRTHPRPRIHARHPLRHDTVILRSSPTTNCRRRS